MILVESADWNVFDSLDQKLIFEFLERLHVPAVAGKQPSYFILHRISHVEINRMRIRTIRNIWLQIQIFV